jgi:hypothetical protein
VTLRDIIKNVQRELPGVEVDGVAGTQTMLAVLNALRERRDGLQQTIPGEQLVTMPDGADTALHSRTVKNLGTLDAKAREEFYRFAMLAEATAATFGCDYIAISGTRDWQEQEDLYKKHKAGGPKAAPPGYSWHNYKLAADFGVFLNGGTIYLDGGNAHQKAVAERVHAACSVHARDCGLVWGGTFKGKSFDSPHYQYDLGHKTPTAADRAKFKQEGSLL